MKWYKPYVIGVVLLTATVLFVGWRRKAANVAAEYINQQEIGNNQGFASKAFESMMRSVGWKGGEAWCMYFAKHVYMNAFPKKAAIIEKILTGSTQGSWKAAKENPDVFRVITEGSPRVGDIAIWQSVSNPSLGHAAIVYRKQGADSWELVEGNSSFEGARDGQGVVKTERDLIIGSVTGGLKLLGYIRIKM